ncbi:DNA-directed RNA polymerase subunit beta' [Candidatus Poribacteria bacterium]|nr:DNA-directed RNA polymerase subunit beta' [Candidatus Poribacteria bacterium]
MKKPAGIEKTSSIDLNSFDTISVGIASPEQIKQWAKETACHCHKDNCTCGEVRKPETINYRTFRPERDGLFCEAIFGPQKDWECACGKYKRIKHRGIVCDRCGVEVTKSSVRRERMGYIQLVTPVTHIWFFKGIPSSIGCLLELSLRELEKVVYFESYIVLDPGDSPLNYKDLLTEDEYQKYSKKYIFRADMGAQAIKELLAAIDFEKEVEIARRELEDTGSKLKAKKIRKRLKLIVDFLKSQNRPEWTILDVIPVIPPELRPLVALDGGRFATSDLNDLYRRVINRNNRLKRLMELRAPDVILRNEKRMLQESVDALLDNGKHGRVVRGPGNRPLKSLSDMLKGKPGRFRQNLLGKRVDYSGRSVIVVGPELQLHECGLPKRMALELFKPFIIHKLQEKGYAQTIKSAKKMAEKVAPDVWEVLEEVIAEHPVLLNRAPTLHRLGIQAFQPILIEGKAIQINPLVCKAFNADFDGDAMAVHVPLATEAQIEAKLLLSTTRNILKPAHGGPVVIPDLDLVLGCSYLTKEKPNGIFKVPVFSHPDEVLYAYDCKAIDIHAPIKVRINGLMIHTTVGRVIFSQILPKELTFVDSASGAELSLYNKELRSRDLVQLVAQSFDKCGNHRTVQFLDALKNLGFHYATLAGISIAVADLVSPADKKQLIEVATREVEEIEASYKAGDMTTGERYNKVVGVWSNLTQQVQDSLFEALSHGREDEIEGFNPVHIMADSGARSKPEAIRQIAGMRGLMQKPSGEIIERPIFASFREGLTVLEYFISTHGARKGLADTAIKTASSGYLTRKLVDVAQDVIITAEDCGTLNGITKTSLLEEAVPFSDKIVGRVAAREVTHAIIQPSGDISEEILVRAGELITKNIAKQIEDAGIPEVKIRSVLTCEEAYGVCRKCYGTDLATGKPVDIGEAIGIIAAQSIGEPGTQLTMRTFHTGGVVSSALEQQSEIVARHSGVVRYHNIETAIKEEEGIARIIVLSRNSQLSLHDENDYEIERHKVPTGATLKVENGTLAEKDQVLLEWDPHHVPILTQVSGTVKFEDIIDNVTAREDIDESTNQRAWVIIEYKGEDYLARVEVHCEDGRVVPYQMPTGAHLVVGNGDLVSIGDILARIPREILKAKDIVTGLPRVTELFEARKPKESALISEIDGEVCFEGASRGMRIIKIKNPTTSMESSPYRVPLGKHIIVQEGDRVAAGEPLTDGPIDPNDMLRIKGENEVQAYLVREVQKVYQAQKERINDKHIEVIARQMMRKVRITSPGNTEFLEGDEVNKVIFQRENEKVVKAGGEPAKAEPILQGISKAALTTESFISAASFQQTTNVLTKAAVSGKRDSLKGLKENVIMGHLVPAGTGVPTLRRIEVFEKESDSSPLLPAGRGDAITDST